MSAYESLNLREAAEHVHLEANELRHAAQRGEVEATERGGDWHFSHAALDEWAQRRLLAAGARALRDQHRAMMDEDRRASRATCAVSRVLRAETVDLALAAKGKAGVLRDMTDLAVRGGLVYDPDALFHGLVEREAAASTAIGDGLALLHPRFHDPYLFESSFIAYGRSLSPVYFGAPEGEATRHFFLIAATDHDAHLHLLARLAVLAHGTDLVERLDAAEDADAVLEAVRACEEGLS